jgi:phytoene dehydrogenase-like protein
VTEKSVVIIGAGLAGLSTGCFSQMNGYQSHIFEHHAQPGGVAAAWRRGEYLIDGGIHFVMGHKPGTALYELYRQLGIVPANRFVDLTAYGRFVHEPSGKSLLLGNDLDQWAATLRSLSPADARIVDELIAGGRAMQGLDMSEMGLSKPSELAGLLDQIKDLWAMRHLLRYLFGKYSQPVASYVRGIHDPVLRACVERLFLPEVPVYFNFMLLGLLADGQMGLIEGGSLEFARSIERHYSKLGGTITYNATVEEILVAGDRAVGVRLADGSEHRADAVVSAADGHSTLFKMLGGRYLNEKIAKRYATWKTTRPLLMASYGVAQEFPGDPPFTTIVLEHPLILGKQVVDGITVRIFNYSPRFAPSGRTVVQVEFETEWEYWYDMQKEGRARYEAEKERVAAELLQRLEAHYPGLSSRVEVTDIVTPYTTWRYTLNDRGAWGGWLMTPEAIRTPVERTLPGLSGFHMAGQWVMPVGGVPSCLYSGRHAVQLLCRQDGKPFLMAVP